MGGVFATQQGPKFHPVAAFETPKREGPNRLGVGPPAGARRPRCGGQMLETAWVQLQLYKDYLRYVVGARHRRAHASSTPPQLRSGRLH